MNKKTKLKFFALKHCTYITGFSMCVVGLLLTFVVSPLVGYLFIPLAVFLSRFWIPDIFTIEARLKKIEDEIQLFKAAHYACFSCRVKLIKPEEAIYLDVLKGLGVKPEEAVFFDDLAANVEAACKLGINGFLWTGLEQGKKDWQQALEQHGF